MCGRNDQNIYIFLSIHADKLGKETNFRSSVRGNSAETFSRNALEMCWGCKPSKYNLINIFCIFIVSFNYTYTVKLVYVAHSQFQKNPVKFYRWLTY